MFPNGSSCGNDMMKSSEWSEGLYCLLNMPNPSKISSLRWDVVGLILSRLDRRTDQAGLWTRTPPGCWLMMTLLACLECLLQAAKPRVNLHQHPGELSCGRLQSFQHHQHHTSDLSKTLHHFHIPQIKTTRAGNSANPSYCLPNLYFHLFYPQTDVNSTCADSVSRVPLSPETHPSWLRTATSLPPPTRERARLSRMASPKTSQRIRTESLLQTARRPTRRMSVCARCPLLRKCTRKLT